MMVVQLKMRSLVVITDHWSASIKHSFCFLNIVRKFFGRYVFETLKAFPLTGDYPNQIPKQGPIELEFPKQLWCCLFVFLYFCIFVFLYFCIFFLTPVYNRFLSSTLFCDRTFSIQLCQFNFHFWHFDRLFVPQIGLSWNPFCTIEKIYESLISNNFIEFPHLHNFINLLSCKHNFKCDDVFAWLACRNSLLWRKILKQASSQRNLLNELLLQPKLNAHQGRNDKERCNGGISKDFFPVSIFSFLSQVHSLVVDGIKAFIK